MAQRAEQPIGFFEATFAFWGLGVLAVSLGLTFAAHMPFLESAKWAVAGSTALTAIYLVSALLHRLVTRMRRAADAVAIERMIRQADRRARQLIKRHSGMLARKRRAAEIVDEQGNIDITRWRREQDNFIERTLLAGLSAQAREEAAGRERLIQSWRDEIESCADRADRSRARVSFMPGMSGSEYEAFCAQILRRGGWRVRNTPDSADQGIDLVAEKRRVTLAIQCKRYLRPVGNGAVQEIVAGRALVDARAVAAVITNSGYTRSARELAAANAVMLLHHEDLPRLEELLDADTRLRRR